MGPSVHIPRSALHEPETNTCALTDPVDAADLSPFLIPTLCSFKNGLIGFELLNHLATSSNQAWRTLIETLGARLRNDLDLLLITVAAQTTYPIQKKKKGKHQ